MPVANSSSSVKRPNNSVSSPSIRVGVDWSCIWSWWEEWECSDEWELKRGLFVENLGKLKIFENFRRKPFVLMLADWQLVGLDWRGMAMIGREGPALSSSDAPAEICWEENPIIGSIFRPVLALPTLKFTIIPKCHIFWFFWKTSFCGFTRSLLFNVFLHKLSHQLSKCPLIALLQLIKSANCVNFAP